MKYTDFLTIIRKNKLYIFAVNEIIKYFPYSSPRTIQNQLQMWEQNGMLLRMKRGVYKIQFPEGGPDVPDLYIANRLYEPSYISLETALSFYSIIPEVAIGVTSLTTRQTKIFKNNLGGFWYRSCKNEAYCGYKIMPYEGFKIYIAEREKAFTDFIYFKNRNNEKIDAGAERFDKEALKKLSWKKVFYYAGIYNKKTLATVRKIKKELE